MTAPEHPAVTASPLALGRRFSDATGRRVTGVSLVVLAVYVGTIVTANWASTHWNALLVGVVAVPAGTLWAGVFSAACFGSGSATRVGPTWAAE
jgi:hypothetical protein